MFPKPPFIMGIVAPRNSGKTLLTVRLVTTPVEKGGYAKAFDEIYLFSPNILADPKLTYLASQLNKERIFLEFNAQKINQILESSSADNSKHKLIICDDCMSEDDFSNQKSDGVLNRIATIGRNRNVSLLIVLQKFKGAPKTFRQNIDSLIVFNGLSKPSIEEIYCAEIPFPFFEKKEFIDQYMFNTVEKYSFIIFNSQNNNSVYSYIPSVNKYKFLADCNTLKNKYINDGRITSVNSGNNGTEQSDNGGAPASGSSASENSGSPTNESGTNGGTGTSGLGNTQSTPPNSPSDSSEKSGNVSAMDGLEKN